MVRYNKIDFTPKDLENLRQEVTEELEAQLQELKDSQPLTEKVAGFTTSTLVDTVEIHKVASSEEILESLSKVISKGGYVEVRGDVETFGRYDHFKTVRFITYKIEPLEELGNSIINSTVIEKLTDMLKPEDWADHVYYPLTIDCSALRLFHEGEISFDKMLETSNKSCDI